MSQRPLAVSLFLCEQVIVEEQTRNVTPVNCFTRRVVEHFPSERLPFVVFAVLTDGLGDVELEVLIHRLDDSLDELSRVVQTAHFASPLDEVRFIFRVRGYSFPVAGHYQVTLLADGELLGQRKLVMLQKEGSP